MEMDLWNETARIIPREKPSLTMTLPTMTFPTMMVAR